MQLYEFQNITYKKILLGLWAQNNFSAFILNAVRHIMWFISSTLIHTPIHLKYDKNT